MAFTDYPVRDGQRIQEVMQATHEVRTATASLAELLAQIEEQEQALAFARSLAVEEARRSLKIILPFSEKGA